MRIKITPGAFLGGLTLILLLLGFMIYLIATPARRSQTVSSPTRAAYSQVMVAQKAVTIQAAMPFPSRAALPDNTADFSGLTELYGPGIVLTLQDSRKAPKEGSAEEVSKHLIHDQDLRVIVNDLFAAGAEAISIGDQRIVGRSTIQAVGPFIQINGIEMTSPFEIRAIGDSDTLFKAVSLSCVTLSRLQRLDPGMVSLRKDQQEVIIPAFRGDTRMRYARHTARPSANAARAQTVTGSTFVESYTARDAEMHAAQAARDVRQMEIEAQRQQQAARKAQDEALKQRADELRAREEEIRNSLRRQP